MIRRQVKNPARAIYRTLVNTLALALLAACGVSGESTDRQRLAGTVDNWPGGSGIVEARSYDDMGQPLVFASGTITPQGTFSLTLPDKPSGLVPFDGASCDDMSISTTDAQGNVFFSLEVLRDEQKIGTVVQADALHSYDGSSPSILVFRMYVDRDVRVTGTCDEGGILGGTFTYNLDLKAGWNAVMLRVIDVSREHPKYTAETGAIPASVKWLYVAAPTGPDPEPNPDTD